MRLNPNDNGDNDEQWRLHNALAMAYMAQDKTFQLALEHLLHAEERVPPHTGTLDQYELWSRHGKLLFSLARMSEARDLFLQVMEEFQRVRHQCDMGQYAIGQTAIL